MNRNAFRPLHDPDQTVDVHIDLLTCLLQSITIKAPLTSHSTANLILMLMIKLGVSHLWGSNSSIFIFCLPSQRGLLLKERICPLRGQILFFRSRLQFGRAYHAGKLTGSHKSYLPLYKWQKSMEVYIYILT